MKILITDCEGIITLNDNAYELSKYFIPGGDILFAKLSQLDDYFYLKDKNNYTSGNTLLFILPFLVAYGIDEEKIINYSKNNLLFLEGAKQGIKNIKNKIEIYIVSTSYNLYIEQVCKELNINKEFSYSTYCDMKNFDLSLAEINQIKKIKELIINSSSLEELEKIFSNINYLFNNKKVLNKEEALYYILEKRKDIKMENIIYIGDSITDCGILDRVREGGGISLGFNANEYAIKSAEFLAISENFKIIEDILTNFINDGKEKLIELTNKIENFYWLKQHKNISLLIEKSKQMRRKIRGEQIAKLS